jgi:hypothetical protein
VSGEAAIEVLSTCSSIERSSTDSRPVLRYLPRARVPQSPMVDSISTRA